ncbi:MAG: hypothetical protein AAFR61_02690 [Bacteroidota bacterium]
MIEDNYIPPEIATYLAGGLSPEAEQAFEQKMAQDPALEAEVKKWLKVYVIGLEETREAWKHELNARYTQTAPDPSSKIFSFKPWYAWAASAAAVILLLVIYFWPDKSLAPAELYAAYYEPLPARELKGQTEANMLNQAHQLYNQKQFSEALALYQQIPADSIPEAVLFAGLAYLELEQPGEARNLLGEVIGFDQEKSWYVALAWLQEGKKEEARTQLESIAATPSHYRQQQAKEILEKL